MIQVRDKHLGRLGRPEMDRWSGRVALIPRDETEQARWARMLQVQPFVPRDRLAPTGATPGGQGRLVPVAPAPFSGKNAFMPHTPTNPRLSKAPAASRRRHFIVALAGVRSEERRV